MTPASLRRPLALSLGDPAGIGPEIAVKAWSALKASGPAFLVVGDHDALAAASPEGERIIRRVGGPDEALEVFPHSLPVLDLPLQAPVVAGKPSPAYAEAVIRWIETGAGLALSGRVSGLVTAPIAKAPLYEAGFGFPGHTEFLAELTAGAPSPGPRGPVMMLTAADLRTVLVTIHIPLAQVFSELTQARIVAGAATSRSSSTNSISSGLARFRQLAGSVNSSCFFICHPRSSASCACRPSPSPS